MNFPNVDTWALILLWLGAPPATLYPLVFGFTTPWRRSPMGRPMLEATIGLALLIDLSLAFRVFGDYPGRPTAVIVAFAVIVLGVYDKSIALGRAKVRDWQRLRKLRELREP